MGIKTFIAVGFVFAAASVQAITTNSWSSTGSDFWDTDARWSLGVAPSLTDFGDFITNAVSKTVSIDDTDTTTPQFINELTISNLTVSGFGSATNTLFLTDMNAGAPIPLHMLNTFTLGVRGQLEITNSMLQAANAVIGPGAILQFAVGASFTPVAVDNNLTLGGILNVNDGGGFAISNYTLFTYGGVLTYNGLSVGSMPSNFVGVVDTGTVGQVKLDVSQATPPPSGGFHITSIVRNTNDILVTWVTVSAGNYFVQAGNGGAGGYTTNNFADIAGPFTTSTTNYLDTGGATNTPTRFYRIRETQ